MSETLESLMAQISGKADVIIDRGDKKIVLYTQFRENRGDCYVRWNIVAIDNTPKIVWRANHSPDTGDEDDLVFTNIYIGDDNKLMAYGGSGYDYVIDESNGQVSQWRDPKWPPGYKPRPW